MHNKQKTFLDKCIRGSDGNIVLGQKPNVYQIVGWASLLASWPLSATAGHIASLVSAATWLIWALLELVAGVNYFRRALGLVVLMVIAYSFLR